MSLPSEIGLLKRERSAGWPSPGTEAAADAEAPTPVPVCPELVDHQEDDAATAVRSLLALWGAAGTVFLVALMLAPPPESRLDVLAPLAGVGLAALLAMVHWRNSLPPWAAEAGSWVCQLAIAVVVWGYGDRSAPFALLYAWFAVHAFWFLPWRRAAGQLAVVVTTYSLALAVAGGGGAGLQWMLTVASLVAVCTLVAVMRHRFDCLVEHLADTAATDRLTGLGNRHTFDEMLEREFERARRANQPLSLVLGDLDGFKEVNDHFGHRAGDEVLRRLAAVLSENCRREEPPLRLGGAEFAFVLVATDAAVAHHFAERIREAVRAEFAADAVPITISLGLASYPRHSPGLADLFRAADDAVYAAKREGRDCTVVGASELTAVLDSAPDTWSEPGPGVEGDATA